ncbi:hypothetical protein DL768_001944 [Monosporascus sp. mg162]|nr:hypothetical protein DL768_001944 [Monosporascus sp. mg162]
MYPGSVGRMISDGTEYVRDHCLLGGFGWTALGSGIDARNDGFLAECINAGREHCALAQPRNSKSVSVDELKIRMESLLESLVERSIPGYTESSGPSSITYSAMVDIIYASLYNAETWPRLAQILYDLELGNSTLAAATLEE